jgi:hypothetical protein
MGKKIKNLTYEEANAQCQRLVGRLTRYNCGRRSEDLRSLWNVINTCKVSSFWFDQAFITICSYAREPGNYRTKDVALGLRDQFELKLKNKNNGESK